MPFPLFPFSPFPLFASIFLFFFLQIYVYQIKRKGNSSASICYVKMIEINIKNLKRKSTALDTCKYLASTTVRAIRKNKRVHSDPRSQVGEVSPQYIEEQRERSICDRIYRYCSLNYFVAVFVRDWY